jgi:hypothetical protein
LLKTALDPVAEISTNGEKNMQVTCIAQLLVAAFEFAVEYRDELSGHGVLLPIVCDAE